MASLGVMHDALHVVAGEQAGDAVADALEPAVVVLLHHVDDGALHERQLVLLVLGVVVDGHHCRSRTRGYEHVAMTTGVSSYPVVNISC